MVEFQDIRVIVLLKRGGDSNFFYWLNNSECLFIERFKHLGNASFFLLHVGVNIEVERCGDVRMSQEHAHGFIIAIAFNATGGEAVTESMILQARNIEPFHQSMVIIAVGSGFCGFLVVRQYIKVVVHHPF